MELNSALTNSEIIERICEGYKQITGDMDEDHFQIIQEPFKVLKIKNVCTNDDFLKTLTEDVKYLDYNRKNNDLYSLWQSEDLTNSDVRPISQFVSILRRDIGKLLSKVMGIEFNDNFTLTASLYKPGDVLLCHDDKCTDRCVAFVYYLTGTGKEEGGAFDMFAKNDKGQPTTVVKSLPAVTNTFICFEVGNFTYHQVSEVRDRTFERLSLNGWFHANRELPPLSYIDPMPPLLKQSLSSNEGFLDEFIHVAYIAEEGLNGCQLKFEIDSQIILHNFLQPAFFQMCKDEFKRCTTWTARGPANRRNYECLEDVQQPTLKKLVDFLGSPGFFSYLSDLTGLSLVPKTDAEHSSSTYSLEVQKWGPGSYTMATDNDEFFQKSGLDLYLWFNTDDVNDLPEYGGTVVYLAADDEVQEEDDVEEEEDKELLSIDPVDNALALVFRTDDTVKFTKYHNHSESVSYYCISATYYESDDS